MRQINRRPAGQNPPPALARFLNETMQYFGLVPQANSQTTEQRGATNGPDGDDEAREGEVCYLCA